MPRATPDGGLTSVMRAGKVRVAGSATGDSFAQPALDRRAPGPQSHADVGRVPQQRELLFRNADHHFLLCRLREADHRLTGADDLADLRVDRGHDGVVRGAQHRVPGLVAGHPRVGCGLRIAGLGGIEAGFATVELGLADEAFRLQVLEPLVVGALLVAIDLCRCARRFRRLGGQAIVLRVDGGERLSLLHRLADLDQALRHAATHLETGAGFDARPDFAGELGHCAGRPRADGHRADRAHVLGGDVLLRAGRQGDDGRAQPGTGVQGGRAAWLDFVNN